MEKQFLQCIDYDVVIRPEHLQTLIVSHPELQTAVLFSCLELNDGILNPPSRLGSPSNSVIWSEQDLYIDHSSEFVVEEPPYFDVLTCALTGTSKVDFQRSELLNWAALDPFGPDLRRSRAIYYNIGCY